jgi:light-regulated signal transduction histidine kinase (bacteriophytochrome)
METFTSEDEQLAQAFAAEVALAYEGLRLYKEVERLNAELTRSNADLRQCTRIACHHLQEPLRSVQGFAQLLTRRYGGRLDPEADEFLSFIQDGVRRMRSLVVDFEEYARLSRPEEARREIVSLDQACRAAIEACSQAVKESGAVVTVEALPVVRGVRSQLCQVFDHLIANAIKFRSAATPAIRIHAEDRAQFHVIGVQDNGTGIEPRHLDRIFEIFERLQGNAVAGTGIGLALCKKIIELHGGRLWVESAVGCGSDFYFTLPMLPSPLADGAPRL